MIKKRAMILVSNDPESIRLGANEIVRHLNEALVTYGLQDEVDVSTVSDVNHSNILPLVVVYPEAVVYGPVKAADVRYLVEEHLYKGRVVNDLLAPPKMLTGQIGWLRGHKGYNPAEQRIVLERAGRIDPESRPGRLRGARRHRHDHARREAFRDARTAFGTAMHPRAPRWGLPAPAYPDSTRSLAAGSRPALSPATGPAFQGRMHPQVHCNRDLL
ncbi:MAG TPA: (2Fe-2S) ferredoxin domain-containing protein, partial [Anaerolineales bacterium]|nr:(2Fe-2S) ferredoxin domain-containing protein [Anaerolineales bacterium]